MCESCVDINAVVGREDGYNDYIKRGDLLVAYDKAHKGPPGGARKLIQEAPAADVVPAPAWISVKDKLPQESGVYLVNVHQESESESGDFVVLAWYNTLIPFFVNGVYGWRLLNEFYNLSDGLIDHITHWMPLPEPPKEVLNEPSI